MPDIVLATLNARWIHASFGLRCLRSNLGPLRERSVIREFDVKQRPLDVVEGLLEDSPRIVALGVYIWNATQSREVVALLKRVAPEIFVVVGGPEVSHETEAQEICSLADCTLRGEADLAFSLLCAEVLAGRPPAKVIDAPLPEMAQLAWPYDEYGDGDVAQRIVYVEASRGCPFSCEFCLSSLDVPVRAAPLPGFLQQMQRLLERGAQHLKFVDRTFNLSIGTGRAILEFFAERLRPGLFLHFEMIPDRLPEALREVITRFPPGVLQFELGIQTFDPATSARISRRQDVAKIEANLRWLVERSRVHVHADLIAGLPGEDLATFGAGFDRLWRLRPHEIQVGILKRLRGTPIVRHDTEHGVRWSEEPPYEVLATNVLPFAELQRLRRFARYFDLVANSGRFPQTVALLMDQPSPFAAFLAFADWLFARTGATHGIAAHRLAELLFEHLGQAAGHARDYASHRPNDWPEFLRRFMPGQEHGASGSVRGRGRQATMADVAPPTARRQARHREGQNAQAERLPDRSP
jgi:radical SAM superfamily enzyme YgiQ (UPF0313 family)